MGIWDSMKASVEKAVGKQTDKLEKADKYMSEKFAYDEGEGPSASRLSAEKAASEKSETTRSDKQEKEAAKIVAEEKRVAGLPEVTPDMIEGSADIKGAWEEYQSWLTDAEARKTDKIGTARAQMAASGLSEESPTWAAALGTIEDDYTSELDEIRGGATYSYLQDQYTIATDTTSSTYGPQRKFRPASGELGMEEWYGQAWGGNSGMAQAISGNFGAQASIYNTPLGA